MKKYSEKHRRYLLKKSKDGSRSKHGKKPVIERSRSNSIAYGYNRRYKGFSSYVKPVKREFFKRDAPVDLSINDNAAEVINFIYELKSLINIKNQIKGIQINLLEVTNIDIGAICILLSVVEEFAKNGIGTTGNVPKSLKCRKVFEKSGFLDHMEDISTTRMKLLESDNVILKRGEHKLDSERTGKIIRRTIKKITGKEDHFKPLFSMINEININSIEHAYKKDKDKHWFFSIYHDDDRDKVVFVFADNGLGIVNTLNRNLGKKFFESLQYDESQILENAFDKKYGSRYKDQVNRNRGLPSIKKNQIDGFIKNLRVITNGVYLNFENNQSIVLKNEYSGTFYYWEFDQKCINLYNVRQN